MQQIQNQKPIANHQLAWRLLFVFAFLLAPLTQKIAVSGRLLTEPWQTGVSGTSTTSYQFDSHTELGPGIRTLAVSDSGQSDSVTSQNGFMQVTGETAASGTASSETLGYSYDALGNTTGRTSSVNGAQTLTWDSFGRLVKVAGTNTTWQAIYDGLGRRIRTIANDSVAGTNDTIDSFYDPEVEFLELGVAINGTRTWKLYGPDRSGVYGGAQGIGGLEAVIDENSGVATGIVNNVFGDAVASVDGSGALTWAGAEVGGYGALPGATAPRLGSASSLLAATIWRGHYLDATGFYGLGARVYDPQSGRFLSPDPLGHDSSTSLYDYANGDPVNGLDPDGRFGKNTLDTSSLSPELQALGNSMNGYSAPQPSFLDGLAQAIDPQGYADMQYAQEHPLSDYDIASMGGGLLSGKSFNFEDLVDNTADAIANATPLGNLINGVSIITTGKDINGIPTSRTEGIPDFLVGAVGTAAMAIPLVGEEEMGVMTAGRIEMEAGVGAADTTAPRLFHYTDSAGAAGIRAADGTLIPGATSGGKVWATTITPQQMFGPLGGVYRLGVGGGINFEFGGALGIRYTGTTKFTRYFEVANPAGFSRAWFPEPYKGAMGQFVNEGAAAVK